MCEAEFEVRSELGLHARPAGRFVAVAGGFEAEIQVGRGGEWDADMFAGTLIECAPEFARLLIRISALDPESINSDIRRRTSRNCC